MTREDAHKRIIKQWNGVADLKGEVRLWKGRQFADFYAASNTDANLEVRVRGFVSQDRALGILVAAVEEASFDRDYCPCCEEELRCSCGWPEDME